MRIESPPWMNECVLTIGNFDGVHLGHRSLIEMLLAMASRRGLPSVVLTFDPPPLKLLRPDTAPKPLTWNHRRESLLKKLGVDHVHFFPTIIHRKSFSKGF
jgi:riboflavin kinase/FMN adenylyltransferase